ncbi:putative exonuclease GOR isoform X7 [Dreissena polymorpha]|uniref:putative exonuclease GOR isoform X7 n=1 Tax=Dreissena polymorpha TaxID=45954 RepID=UPI0022652EFC|nr:putative exonuclease GOR isoform X7 [Dreissena polymorpha]
MTDILTGSRKRKLDEDESLQTEGMPEVKTKPPSLVAPIEKHDEAKQVPVKPKQKRSRQDIYQTSLKFVLTENQLKSLDYPRPDSSGKEGKIRLYGDHYGFEEGKCKRCERPFDTSYSRRSACDFHLERSKRIRGVQLPYGCCGRRYGSKGCHQASSHVYKGNLYLDTDGFKSTKSLTAPPKDGNYGIYAIDTESIHTKKGLEVCKVTVIDTNFVVVYDEYCLPTTEIIDYNTIWSGITEKHLKDVTKTFEELRDDLLALFNKDTIVVGHGLSSDMMVLKILHSKIIDTLILYPHPRGLPLKRSLKDIALTELNRSIQNGVGHDSKEDAEVTMKLLLKKLKSVTV